MSSKPIFSKRFQGVCLWLEPELDGYELDVAASDERIDSHYRARVSEWKLRNPKSFYCDYRPEIDYSARYANDLSRAKAEIWAGIIVNTKILDSLLVWKKI